MANEITKDEFIKALRKQREELHRDLVWYKREYEFFKTMTYKLLEKHYNLNYSGDEKGVEAFEREFALLEVAQELLGKDDEKVKHRRKVANTLNFNYRIYKEKQENKND